MSLNILITGGSKGIGKAILEALLADGHHVANLSRTPPETPEPAPSRFAQLACDLGKPDTVAKALQPWLASRRDGVDAFIHSAVAYGTNRRRPVSDTTREEWDDAMNVNARSLLLILQEIVPDMLHRAKGRIVGISSDVATGPGPGRIPYAASKAAAHAILTGLAEELADSEVFVCELMPTHQVDTPGIRSRRPADFQPDGYATAASFAAPIRHLLCCTMNSIHGTCLSVDPTGALLDATGTRIG